MTTELTDEQLDDLIRAYRWNERKQLLRAAIAADRAARARAQRKPMTIAEINNLPAARAGWWPCGIVERVVRLVRDAEAFHGIEDQP